MKHYQIKAIQKWDPFVHNDTVYSLEHLNAHELSIDTANYGLTEHVVTYGFHCFTKDNTQHNIDIYYGNKTENRPVCLERYNASKKLKEIVLSLTKYRFYKTNNMKYFTVNIDSFIDKITGEKKSYKLCLAFFKENRLNRIHVTTAFFNDKQDYQQKHSITIYKIISDTRRLPKNTAPPKEAA